MPSILSLRARGRLAHLGLTGGAKKGVPPVPADLITVRELTIIGSNGMQARHYPEMLRMVEAGKLKPSALVMRSAGRL